MSEATFRVPMIVRNYELDALGHVNQAEYHHYAEHARVELFRRAGVSLEGMVADGAAPVMLESRVVYRKELRASQEFEVDCEAKFGTGKTFAMNSTIWLPDGTVSATIECTLGVMDLHRRKLITDPAGMFAAHSSDPESFGLPAAPR